MDAPLVATVPGRPATTFVNSLWDFDQDQNVPLDVIGTSRGVCLDVVTSGMASCQWTLTVASADDAAEEEEDSKLMLEGDTTQVDWRNAVGKQTFSIIGGTGDYFGKRGWVEVSTSDMFRVYEVHLS